MSRTALRCFLALGISISLAAACGDDDGGDGDGGSGGSAGNAGSNGMSGSSGSSGEGGTSGGSAGSAGESGSSGAAGDGGSSGTGGNGGDGGTGGEEPDAGDGGPDGSVEPDASTGGTGGAGGAGGAGGSAGTGGAGGSGSTADCPANQNGIETTADVHELAIVRVLFDGAGQVVIRNVIPPVVGDAGGTSLSLQSVFLCNGPDSCVDLGAEGDCTESGDDDGDLLSGEEATCDSPSALVEAGGELAVLNAAAASESAFVRSYVVWGVFDSEEPDRDAGQVDSLEDRAVDGEFWTLGDRIAAPAGGDDAIYATGVLNVETGYTTCTED